MTGRCEYSESRFPGWTATALSIAVAAVVMVSPPTMPLLPTAQALPTAEAVIVQAVTVEVGTVLAVLVLGAVEPKVDGVVEAGHC